MKKKLVLTGFVALFLSGLAYLILNNESSSLLNPLGINKTNSNVKKNSYKIFGFLPSFMVGKTQEYNGEINNLVFLGVEVDEEGNLIWDNQSKKINSESYLGQKERIKKAGGQNILGIKLFDDNKITKLLTNESAKLNLIEQIKKTTENENFDGVNIDFEYQGSPTEILEDEFYEFIDQLKQSGIKNISVDVFSNTVIKGSADQINKLLGKIDDLIVMAYDFHRSGSSNAGPVAPINAPVGDRNILEVVQKTSLANLDRKKITLAFPLYGYEWKTDSTDFGSGTKKGWIALASYKRMREMLSSKDQITDLKENWDEVSMSPWLSYTESGEIHEIYYENLESIGRKLKLVSDNQLGGVGFWALGYEGEYSEVWDEVGKME